MEFVSLFEATLNPDANVRRSAEDQLQKAAANPGFVFSLLDLIANDAVNRPSKHSITIYLKNNLKTSYSTLSDADKRRVQISLFKLMVTCPNELRKHVIVCISVIIARDEGKSWPTYVTDATQMIKSGELNQILAGSLCLLELVKLYRWCVTPEEKRPLFNNISVELYPDYHRVISMFAQNQELHQNEDAIFLVKTILKLMHNIFYSLLPKLFHDINAFEPWLGVYFHLIELSVKYPGSMHWEKTQKWAFYNILRLVTRYGSIKSNVYKEEAKMISGPFMDKYANVLMQFLSSQVQSHVSGKHLHRKSLYSLISLLTECLRIKQTWNIMQSAVDQLVNMLIFPLLSVTDEDIEMLQDDPQEYVNGQVGFTLDFMIPASAAALFISTLYTEKKKTASPIVQNILQNAINQQTNVKVASAGLHLMEISASSLLKDSNIRIHIPQLLTHFILPCLLSSKDLILCYRAFQVLGSIADWDEKEQVQFQYNQQPNNGWNFVFQFALEKLKPDNNLAIRVASVACIEKLLERETIKQSAGEFVTFMMENLVDVTNSVDFETSSLLMQRLVEIYPENVLPFAVQLANSLHQTFMKQSAAIAQMDIDADNSDKVIASMGVLKTLTTLYMTVPGGKDGQMPPATSQALFEQLEAPAMKCIYEIFSNELVDLFEEAFELLDCCLFCRRHVSETAWQIFTVIDRAFAEEYADYIKELYDIYDDYIRFAPAVVAGNQQILNSIVRLANQILQSHVSEEEIVFGFKMFQSLLLNCRGYINAQTQMEILTLILSAAGTYQSVIYKAHALEAIMASLITDSALTLGVLVERQLFDSFIASMIELTDNLVRVYDRKLAILAICELLKSAAFEFRVAHVIPQLIKPLIVHLRELPKAEKARQDLLREENDSVGGEDGDCDYLDQDEDFEEDEGDVVDEIVGDDYGDHEDDTDFYHDIMDMFDDLDEETILDNVLVNPVVHAAFFEFQKHHSSIWNGILGTIGQEERAFIESIHHKYVFEHLKAIIPLDCSWHMKSAGRNALMEFKKQHIPGARFFDVDEISDKLSPYPHMLPSKSDFEFHMSNLGISNNDHVVVYDDSDVFSSYRVYWTMKVFGHERVSVLNGGLKSWLSQNYPVESGSPKVEKTPFKVVKMNMEMLKDYNQICDIVDGNINSIIVDARSTDRFTGAAPEPRPGLSSGHMPTAVNIPFKQVLKDGKLASDEEIKSIFASKGINVDQDRIVFSCGSGVTASVLYTAARKIGAKNISVYDGSWSEYAAKPNSKIIKE